MPPIIVKQSVGEKLRVWLATGFGLGLSPVAPGTAGTIPGVLIACAINYSLPQWWLQAAVAAVLAVLSIPICDAGEKHFGTKDPHPVVADEYRKSRLFPFTERLPWPLDAEPVRRRMPWAGTWTPGGGSGSTSAASPAPPRSS